MYGRARGLWHCLAQRPGASGGVSEPPQKGFQGQSGGMARLRGGSVARRAGPGRASSRGSLASVLPMVHTLWEVIVT